MSALPEQDWLDDLLLRFASSEMNEMGVQQGAISENKYLFTLDQTKQAILTHEIEMLTARDNQHQEIYDWLLGESGDFPASEPGKRYGFRTELRRKINKLKGGK
jgi:hypothetical protein